MNLNEIFKPIRNSHTHKPLKCQQEKKLCKGDKYVLNT